MLRKLVALTAVLIVLTGAAAAVAPPAGADVTTCPTPAAGEPAEACLVLTITGSEVKTQVLTASQLGVLADQDATTEIDCTAVDLSLHGYCSNSEILGPLVSIHNLIARTAGIDPSDVSGVTLTANGKTVTLDPSHGDLEDPASGRADYPFIGKTPEGQPLAPAVGSFLNNAGLLIYAQPQVAPRDINSVDSLTTAWPQPMYMNVSVIAPPLHVSLSASPSRVRQGEVVRLQASVQEPGTASFAWAFGDGTTASSATGSTAHRFNDPPGTYEVQLTVRRGSSTGTAFSIVHVGKAPAADPGRKRSAGAGKASESHLASGPVKGEGFQAGTAPHIPDSRRFGVSRGKESTYRSGTTAGRSRTGLRSRLDSRGRRPGHTGADGFVSVAGTLLTPSVTAVVPHASRVTGQAETAPAARAGSIRANPWVFRGLLIGVVLALLGLGAASELRGTRQNRRA